MKKREQDRLEGGCERRLDPANGARHLGGLGDGGSLPDLVRAFDRLAADPVSPRP